MKKCYTYATGRVRALEARLLNKQAFERLIESQSETEAIFILREYGVSETPEVNLTACYKILDELTQDRPFTDLFRLRYDFRNLKAILQSTPKDRQDLSFSRLGLFDLDVIKRMANKERLSNIPFDYKAVVRLAEGLTAQLLNLAIDKYYIGHIFSHMADSFLIKTYFKKYVDLKNLVFYLRLKENRDLLSAALLEGGYLDNKQFLGGIDIKTIRQYEAVIDPGIEHFRKTKDLGIFEKLCDDYLLDCLRPARHMPFGIEPLFGYCRATEYQADSVSAILFSKRNGIPKDEIRLNLRESYA